MKPTVNVTAKKQLAKLLATENLTVVHAGTRTATFDPKRRILTLPIWKDMDGDLYDLLVLHEVGHAINSPKGTQPFIEACNKIDSKYPKAAKTFLNVVEDARIEKLIKRRYPGSKGSFIRGYKQLVARNFFGTKDKNINDFGIIDRINIHFKVGHEAVVKFSDEELKFVKAIEEAVTFDDVVSISMNLYAYAKKERSDKKKSDPDQLEHFDEDKMQGNNDTEDLQDDDTLVDPDEETADLNDGESTSEMDEGESEGTEESEESEEDDTSTGDTSDSADGEKVKGKDSEEEGDDEPVTSETDNSFSEQQDSLVNTDAKPIRYLGIPVPKLENIIVDYKTVHKQIRSFYEDLDKESGLNVIDQHIKEFERFKHENKPVVDWLLKEFEMHKAADEYSRELISETGELDMDRIHEYKYSDDILLTDTIKPAGKNHGNLIFVDFSGSMRSHLLGTIHQLINLVMFQRKSQISFRVFTFGAIIKFPGTMERIYNTYFKHSADDFAFNNPGFTLREILSSEMNSKEFNDACVNLLLLVSGSSNSSWGSVPGRYSFLPPTDQMGGTPLNESIVCAIPLVEQMRKSGIQTVNITILTDGEATTDGYRVISSLDIAPIDYLREDVYLRDSKTRIDYKLNGSTIETTNQFLHILRERTGSNVIGFFISGDDKEQERAFRNFLPVKYSLLQSNIDKLKKELKDNYFIVATETGYTEFYILPGGQQLKINQSGSPLSGLFTNSQVITAMSSYGQKQRKQRVLLTRYIKLVS